MTTTKKTTTTDQVKKGYNEKNPAQPQGVFTPDTQQQPAKVTKTNAVKGHEKEKKNNNQPL